MARPQNSTTLDRILDALRDAGSTGITSTELIEKYGPCARTRGRDLVSRGWDIRTDESGPVAVYTLVSNVQGPPIEIMAGCIVREDPRAGWTLRVHDEGLKHETTGPTPCERPQTRRSGRSRRAFGVGP